jgi:DNA polymerase III subunit delta'
MTVWDVFGDSRTVAGLRSQVARREAHAWLLLGPSGSGKRAAALAMAAALDCEVSPGAGCGSCSSCHRILRRRHPDVHHISPEGLVIPVDVVREAIIPEAARSPFESPFKVFVIEEADRMNDAAQNALLKTLEEPEPDTVFILVSDNEEELLETLRSRCRVVHLDPISEGDVVAMLRADGAASVDAVAAARAAEGDVEVARAVAFDEATRARRRLWSEVPERLTAPQDALEIAAEIVQRAREAARERERAQRGEVAELADAMGEGRGTAAARNALQKRHRRELKRVEEEVIGEALTYLASFYRDAVVLRSGASDDVITSDARDAIAAWAASHRPDRALLAAAERCLAARASFVSNANPTLAVEAALVDVTRLLGPSVAAPA